MLVFRETRRMARKGGRPKPGQVAATAMVRVRADLAEMISEICRLRNTSSAMLLDPMIRPELTAKYEALKPVIEAIEKTEESTQQAAEGGPKKRKA